MSAQSHSKIAIAGCGAISAAGCGVDALKVALEKNAVGLRSCNRFDSPRFQSSIAGAARPDGAANDEDDPAYRLANEALKQARGQGRRVLESIPTHRIGLVLSTTKANIEALERLTDGRPCPETARRHIQADLLAFDLAAANGVGGPVQCVSLACISGLIALQQGAKLIQRNAADAVLVAGVDHLSDFVVAGFSALKALDPLGCRPFSRDRCGLSPGEAGAAILLARAEAVAEPAIIIRGWGSSNDANHMTGPSRDGSGLALAVRCALRSAGLDPADIHYVSAHGTGTPYNDAMELQAFHHVFGASCPPFNSFKGMLGHTLGAAGVLETILCAIAMQERLLPGTPGLKDATPEAPGTLMREPRSTERLDRVLKVNVGFGGVNGALVLAHE